TLRALLWQGVAFNLTIQGQKRKIGYLGLKIRKSGIICIFKLKGGMNIWIVTVVMLELMKNIM
ncbi:MAG: hypothetical protein ABS951_09180, partial [Solibacillus sp.]